MIIPDEPILVLPKLAKAIGLNEAIALQQLFWLLRNPRNGKEVSGERWIYNTLEQWRADFFPFWSEDTIMRTFQNLERMFLVESCQPEGRVSRRKYYRPNRGGLSKLTTDHFPDTDILRTSAHDTDKLRTSDNRKLSASCVRASIDSEKTTKKTGASALGVEDQKFPEPLDVPEFRTAWSEYLAYRREQKFSKLRAMSLTAKLEELSEWGSETAIIAIRETIRNGWQGIFKPKATTAATRMVEKRRGEYALREQDEPEVGLPD